MSAISGSERNEESRKATRKRPGAPRTSASARIRPTILLIGQILIIPRHLFAGGRRRTAAAAIVSAFSLAALIVGVERLRVHLGSVSEKQEHAPDKPQDAAPVPTPSAIGS